MEAKEMKVFTRGKRRDGEPAPAAYSIPDTQNVSQNNKRFSRFPRPQAEIRAELIGSDECTAVAGLAANHQRTEKTED
jgi:hypothetical protein